METVFLTLLNRSLVAGLLAAVVLVLRLLLKKAPRWITVGLWALVALRLLCPVSVVSVFSLIPSAAPVPAAALTAEIPTVDSGLPAVDALLNPVLAQSFSTPAGDSASRMQVAMAFAAALWLVGMAGMLLYALVGYIRLRRQVREAVRETDGCWVCDRVDTPFILGVFRPRIYPPPDLSAQERVFVVAHERAHLRRGDHIWKPLGFLLLAVYWFQPLLWVGYRFFCRDLELACDERVLRTLGAESKKPYAAALIRCSAPRRGTAACPLAFGETGVKARIQAILHWKKPAVILGIVAAAVGVAAAVCLLTDPPLSPGAVDQQASVLSGVSANERIHLSIVEATLAGETPQITLRWYNNGNETFSFNPLYCIYRLEEDGSRTRLPRNDGLDFHAIGYSLPAGDSRTETYNLEKFAPFSPGQYRLYLTDVQPTVYYVDFAVYGVEEKELTLEDGVRQISWDLDGDGVVEECSLVPGLTSGLSTFRLVARVNGQIKYSETYCDQWLGEALSPALKACLPKGYCFVTDREQLKIGGVFTQGEPERRFTLDIAVQEGRVHLYCEGKELDPRTGPSGG